MRDENLVLKAHNSELQARLTLMEKKKSKKKGGASRHRVGRTARLPNPAVECRDLRLVMYLADDGGAAQDVFPGWSLHCLKRRTFRIALLSW